jgi:UDP-hydrolysing UDP-N-acetyl-D-glucosamine 2-epimerase
VVAREFGVPCIVGLKNAMSDFSDGDIVEVDADNGIVKLISKAGVAVSEKKSFASKLSKPFGGQDQWMLAENIPDMDMFFAQIFLSCFTSDTSYPFLKNYSETLSCYKGFGMDFYFGRKDSFEVAESILKALVEKPDFGDEVNKNIVLWSEKLVDFAREVYAMTKSTGFGLLNLPEIFEELKPDIALINGDRFEIFSVAIASAFMNIPLAHIEGGDVSGTIDNSIRHAITKLAHIHFPATKESERRIICMGEDARMVFTYGSPTIDMVKGIDTTLDNSLFDRYPTHVGSIDLTKPYMLIAHHPVTTEHKDNYRQMKELLAAIDVVGMPQFFVSTNIDAGSDGIARAMREYRAGPGAARSVFHKHVSLEDYTKLLAHATVAVGNSSSFLREAGYFGTPAVIVGTRQQFRERGENVIEVTSQTEKIVEALQQQLRHGKYPSDLRFGDGTASSKIAEKLATIDLKEVSVQKYFCEQK